MKTTVPLRLPSVMNCREHWAAKARRIKKHRRDAWLAMKSLGSPPPAPLTITITRIGTKSLDTDNLAASAKGIRDGIADWLDIDDGDERLDWRYEQRRGPYSVEVQIICSKSES